MNGDRRLYFYDAHHGRQVDVFVDVFRMSHAIDLRGRLEHEHPAVSPSDLLLSKLQIYEVNRKDLVDVVALMLDHSVEPNAQDDAIEAAYIARVAAEDWGFYRTLQVNTERLREMLEELEVDRRLVNARLDELWKVIEGAPKPLKWRLRARRTSRSERPPPSQPLRRFAPPPHKWGGGPSVTREVRGHRMRDRGQQPRLPPDEAGRG